MHLELLSVKLEMQLASVNWEAKFESQVSSIFNKIVVESEEQSNKIETIKQDLEKVIHTVYSEAVVTVFGSANCGLSLVSSDVDCSVNIKYNKHLLETVSLAISKHNTFKRTKSFNNNFPFIRSIHVPSDTEFDLTFNNEEAIATTQLLARIMNLDPRVKQLTLLIKIWCKIHCLMSPGCLNSISMYMLVIFYLQQQGIVPSVCNMLDKTNQRYVNGYNVAIQKKDIDIPRGNKYLLQLLGDFFVFCSNIDWQKFAVCPFTALLIPKTDFTTNSNNLPVEYKDYKIQKKHSNLGNKHIIIQHALIHSRNCSENMKKSDFKYFCEKIKEAAVIYTQNSNKSFLRKILLSPEKPEKSALINGEGQIWSVTGFSASTTREELVQLFSKYGKVKVENMDQGIAIVKFKDKFGVQRLMSDNCIIQLQGQQLQVKYFKHGVRVKTGIQRFARSNEKNTIISPSEIDLTGDFDSQLKSLLSAVSLTKQEVNDINQLYSDVENTLQPQWPGCKVIPFGSLTTGLGIKSSDADCYISGAWSGDQAKAAVSKAKRLLQQRRDLFAEILPITRANTPIVKLFHLPTQTNCDIGFKTPLGTHNRKLVAFLLQCDPQLIPISVVIKYWAKIHGLTGSGRMSNYALTMLVIFYLQQPPLNILPAVHCLQNVSNREMVDGWNTGFAEDLLPRDKKQLTISQLLAGFFQFFAKFDFNKYVVCPYLGRPIEKELFNKRDSLPKEFDIYKHNIKNGISPPLKISSAMCVQDPFEQCRNVASTVSIALAAEIKAYFKFAGELYDQNDSSDFLKNMLMGYPKLEELPIEKQNSITCEWKLNKELIEIIHPDWHYVTRQILQCIFTESLTMKMELINTRDKVSAIIEKYNSNIDRNVWERGQRSLLSISTKHGASELIEIINDKFKKIDDRDICIPTTVKININKKNKLCSVIFTFKNLLNQDKDIFKDFSAFVNDLFPIWFNNLVHLYNTNKFNNPDYRQAVTVNGYEINTDEENTTAQYPTKIDTNKNTNTTKTDKDTNSINNDIVSKSSVSNVSTSFCHVPDVMQKQTSKLKLKELILKKVLQEVISSDWYHCLPYIFKVFLTMKLKTFGYKDEDDLVSITYTSNINREAWERCQRGRLSRASEQCSKELKHIIDTKFVQIGDNDINLPVIIKIEANKAPKKLRVIFILEDHVNDDKEIFNDFTAFVINQMPIWFRYLHNNAKYKNAVALNGYQIIKDVPINADDVCAVNNNVNIDSTLNDNNKNRPILNDNQSSIKQNNLKKSQNTYYYHKRNNKQSNTVIEIKSVKEQQNKSKASQNASKTNITINTKNPVNEIKSTKEKQNKTKESQNTSYYKKKKTKKQNHTVIEIENELQNKLTKSLNTPNKNITNEIKTTVIEIKFQKVQQEIIGPNWHEFARLILTCIFKELLNMKPTNNITNETAELVIHTFCTVINRDVWERCQRSLLSRSKKLGLLQRINRINNRLMQIGDSKIHLPITVNIYLQKDCHQCSKVTLIPNNKNDINAIFKDFNAFATELFPIWFRNLVHLCNTNNFNNSDYRKAVTLNGYEVDFKKEPTVQNPIKTSYITEISRDTINNIDNVNKSTINGSSQCGNKTNMIHSQTSESNSNKSSSSIKESNITKNDKVLNGKDDSIDNNKSRSVLNDIQDTIKPDTSNSKVNRNKVQKSIIIGLDLIESTSVTNLYGTISILKIIESVFFEMLQTEHFKILGKTADCTRIRHHLVTSINNKSWKRCQEHRLIRAMKLGDKKHEKEIVSTIAQVDTSDINIPINITVEFFKSTKQCQVLISLESDVEDEDRIDKFTEDRAGEFMEFAKNILPELFSKLLHYCYNASDSSENSSKDIYLRAIYKMYVAPCLKCYISTVKLTRQ